MYKVARELRLYDKIVRAPGYNVADYFGLERATEAEVIGLTLVDKKPLGVFVRITVRARLSGSYGEVDREVEPNDVFTLG